MAKWTTKYKDSLPDSCFLYVAPGGEKDDEGKTVPRSKRMFPVRDADGKIDKDHLDDALSRLDDKNSTLSKKLRARLSTKAEKLLAEWKKKHSMKKSLADTMSYNDLRQELQSIVQEKYGKRSKDGGYWTDYPWIVDVYEDEFVVEKDGKYYIADYSVDKDGAVDIGEFYKARKVYNKLGKTPVKKIGVRGSSSGDAEDARG